MNQDNQPSIFEDIYDPLAVPRKYMIPKWIRFFCWVFAIFCSVDVLGWLVTLLFGLNPSFGSYSIQTSNLLSLLWVFSFLMICVKGATAIAILSEQDWAIKLAIAFGFVEIAMSVYQMITGPWVTKTSFNGSTSTVVNLGGELIFLIPFLIKMIRIRQQWEENRYGRQVAKLYGNNINQQ